MAGLVEKLQKMWNPPDDEYDEYYDEEPVSTSYADREEPAPRRSSYTPSSSNRVVNINSRAHVQVVVFRPISFGEETRGIADELNNKHTVILNLQKTEKEESRRILDFLSGVAYANDGKIKRVSTGTFIITPYNVDLSGDEVMDELEQNGGFF